MNAENAKAVSALNDLGHKIPENLKKYITDESVVVFSPGRVNLIGEHVDYNDGLVLPAAISKVTYMAVTPRQDDVIHLSSLDFNDTYSTTVSELKKYQKSWPNYILGVVEQLQKNGYQVKGFDAFITGNIPMGAGLSSSAAIECATGAALSALFGFNIDKIDLVKMAQKAENEFVGVKCGIMDQFASVFGKTNQLIKIDCRTLEYEYIPFEIDGYRIVLLDTQVKHSLASSAYNKRREECEEGAALINKKYPQVKSLRDATVEMVEECIKPVDSVVYDRCLFVVKEINRLITGCEDLKKNDLVSFGKKMFETHEGLSKKYEVSCSELDFLVEYVKDNPNVLGSRMMGGGFGGCTINIVKEEAIDDLITHVGEAYEKATGLVMKAYVAEIGNGTTVVIKN